MQRYQYPSKAKYGTLDPKNSIRFLTDPVEHTHANMDHTNSDYNISRVDQHRSGPCRSDIDTLPPVQYSIGHLLEDLSNLCYRQLA